MSKKLKTRLVLVLVLIIWGFNIYRTYQNHVSEELIAEAESGYTNLSFSPMMFNKDSFELELPDIDPFLKKQSKSVNHTSSSSQNVTSNQYANKTKVNKVVQPVVQKTWPQIKYMGFVKNRDQDKTLCLIQINNRMSKVGKGEEKSGVYVSNVYRDSVHLVYSGEERTFLK